MLDQRSQPRVPVSKAGKITLDNGTKIECFVINRSSGGVGIEVDSPARVPESFVLTMGTDDINRACRVRWRLGKRLGLAFE